MPEILELRKEIDQIHSDIFQLLRRRFEIARLIWSLKKSQNLDRIDLKRDSEIIHQFDGKTQGPFEQKAVQNIFKSVLNETKNFLNETLS